MRYPEEKMRNLIPLEGQKTAKQLGIKVGRRFVVLSEANGLERGEVVEFSFDDNTEWPYFVKIGQDDRHALPFCKVALLPSTKEEIVDAKLAQIRKELLDELECGYQPKVGERVYWISSQGIIKGATYKNDTQWRNRRDFIGLFKTEKEAQTRKQEISDLKNN